MKKVNVIYLLLLISSLISGTTLFAQKYPVAVSAEKGLLIFVGNDAQNELQYVVEKKEGNSSNYSPLIMLKRPSTLVEFKSLLLYYSTMVTSINVGDEKIVQNAWNELNNSASGKTPVFAHIPAVALASGLAYYDTAVSINNTYTYKVSVMKNGKSISSTESQPIKFVNQIIANSISFKLKTTDEKHVYIEWKILGMPKPTSFEVFRSIVSKTEFTNTAVIKGFRSSGDTLILVIKDTLVRPNENYRYYIQAKDLFGNSFERSEQVRVSASSNASDPIVFKFNAISNEKRRAIELNFTIKPTPEIRGITIERSEEFDGKYSLLVNIPITDSTYFDKSAIPFKSYYYRMVIHTLNGKTFPSSNVSGFLSVKQFLMSPFHFVATTTNKGVDLSWENSEPNIVGFVVYRCEGYKGILEPISQVISPKDLLKGSYTDSLVQPKKVYSYAVKSVDKLMTESLFTDTVSVIPTKNTNPPATPTRLRAKPSSTEIMLTWDDMYSQEPLIIGYNIYRKKSTEKDQNFVKLNSEILSNQHNYYSDSTITPEFSYAYAVESIDVFEFSSGKSAPVQSALITPKPVSPSGIRLFNQPEGVLITWDEPENRDLSEYRLFRISGDSKPILLEKFKPGISTAIDKTAKTDNFYVYYLISVSKYNIESDVIGEVSIRR